MNKYRVAFYKDILNSNGHSFKCMQRQIDVRTDSPSQALVLAQKLTESENLEADCVEVLHLPLDHPHSGAASENSVAYCKHTWNRVPGS